MSNHAVACALSCLLVSVAPAVVRADVAGPLGVSADGRHFVDRAGKPFYWLGDTAWPLFAEYPKESAEAYLRDRAAKGFTVIQGVLAWTHGGSGFEKNKQPMANIFGEPIWKNGNPATPNEAYFRHVDHLVAFANKLGVVLAILPTWGFYVNQAGTITAENARAYARWVAKRYEKAPNVIWMNGGDRVPTGFENVYRELAAGLADGDRGAHLVTYHPSGMQTSADWFHDDKWLDFNMLQTWTDWPKTHPFLSATLVRTPRKPVVLGEGAYENGPEYPLGPITPLIVRRQAWWTATAGAFHTYGQDQMWRMHAGWEKTFDTPGAKQVAQMKTILTTLPWWELSPDQSLFASGVGSERTLNTAMRSRDARLVLAYLASQTTVSIHMDRIRSKTLKATFINAATGERKDAGLHETGNFNGKPFPEKKVQPFTTPGFWEDAVLLLEAAE